MAKHDGVTHEGESVTKEMIQMTLNDAVKVLDASIPEPSNKMVDRAHLDITVAWRTVKEYIEKAGREEKKSFTINIREILEMQVTVEAESLTDAIRKVKQSYENEEYILSADNYTGTEFTEVET